jgi:hypothetical protein
LLNTCVETSRALRRKPASTRSFSGKAATACLAASIRISPRAARLVMV